MVEWSRAFDNIPIYLHAADRQWVMRPDPSVVFWEGDSHALGGEITLIHCGGHFSGSTVLHCAAGAEGRGTLLTGDTLYVVSDRRYVSFMRSYPNLIPLSGSDVQAISSAIESYPYDRIYAAWYGRTVSSGAKEAVRRSVSRYLQIVGRS
jgi:hypothetical protein